MGFESNLAEMLYDASPIREKKETTARQTYSNGKILKNRQQSFLDFYHNKELFNFA